MSKEHMPRRRLLSYEDGKCYDVSKFFDLLMASGNPDKKVEDFAAAPGTDIDHLGEDETLVVAACYMDGDQQRRQALEIKNTLGEISVHFLGPLAISADISPESDDRPTGFALVDPIDSINSERTLGSDRPRVRVGYYLSGEAHFEDGSVCPEWTFGPIDEATLFSPHDLAA